MSNPLDRIRRRVILCAAMALFLGADKAFAGPGHWVTTWATSPYLTEQNNLPPEPLAHKTLRQFVRTSIGAKHLRLRFCNAYGTSPVTIQSAHLALAAGTGSAGTGEINPATDRALAFRGAPGVVIPAGETIWSDSLAYDLPVTATVAISLHFGEISASTITGHPGSRTTSFIEDGNVVSTANLPDAAKTDHWYVIHAIEALAGETGRTVAILGDSITDGRGSTTNGQDRWPDQLATRLAANPPTANVGVANLGIGANGVLGQASAGFPSGQARFSRDILNQTGVRYFIVFEGINDIAYSGITTPAAATARANDLIAAYTSLANQARARNIKPYAATITPFGTSGTYTATLESIRQTVNDWIRNNTVFDGHIDFDAVVRDPSAPSNLLPAYIYQNDGLHINTTGYQAMVNSVNLNLFTP
ncbi:MAG: SGNH/GDSL hydrolase family protein [Verrucomicrobiota bacterium]